MNIQSPLRDPYRPTRYQQLERQEATLIDLYHATEDDAEACQLLEQIAAVQVAMMQAEPPGGT